MPYAWQLTEAVDQFLDRLPPSTTSSEEVPWIFICNPYIQRVDKRHSDKVQLKGSLNDNEAPDEEGSNVQLVVEGGEERLELVKSFEAKIAGTGKAKSTIDREVSKERKQAATDILELAHAYKVRAGKVMDHDYLSILSSCADNRPSQSGCSSAPHQRWTTFGAW